MTIPIRLGISNAENERKIANAGTISEYHVKVFIGVFFCLAVFGVTGRMVTRIYTRRRLYLDDAFLVFGLTCLCAATVLCYRMVRTLCLVEALQRYPGEIIIPIDQLKPLLDAMAVGVSVLCLTWTTTFVVKFSFLILFWHLIQRTSKWIHRYYWAVTGTCVISWMFVICEPFILCHYFGADTVKCFTNIPYRLNAAMTGLITALDIVTDIMIVSIPIIILRRTQLKMAQRISLSAFLCLSVAMIIIACIRVSGLRDNNTVWIYFWQYMEACVACIMASILTFRTLFVSDRTREFKPQRIQQGSIKQRVLHNMKIFNMAAWEKVEDDSSELPEIPSATISGLRTYIRQAGSTTATTSDQDDVSIIEEGLHVIRIDTQQR